MADEIIVRIRAEGQDAFIKELKKAGVAVEAVGDEVEKTEKRAKKSFDSIGKSIAAGLTVGAFVQFEKAVRKLAVDLDATEAKFNTVFGNAGRSVEDFARKNARALGLTVSEFKKASAAVGDLLVPLGFQRQEAAKLSSELVKLSGSLAAWDTQQRSSTEITDILSKAILGEREQLKSLGINITEADVKQRLFEKGQKSLEGSALAQAKALATVELITLKSADAQASATDSTITLREEQLKLNATLRQNAQDFVQRVIPAYKSLLGTLNGFFEAQSFYNDILANAREGTFQQVQADKELLQINIDRINAKKEEGKITLSEQVTLSRLEQTLSRVNKIEAERDFRRDIGGRRGGATDEQREAIAAAKAADEAAKAEQARLDEVKRQEEAQKALAKEIERTKKLLSSMRGALIEGTEEGSLADELDKLRKELEKTVSLADQFSMDLIGENLLAISDTTKAFIDSEKEKTRIRGEEAERRAEIARQEAVKEADIQVLKARSVDEISEAGFNVAQNIFDRQIQGVQQLADAEVISREEAAAQISEIRRKQAIADRAQAVFNITVDTARAVVASLARVPLPLGAPLVALNVGLGAAQLASVLSAPIPQFAKGTEFVKGNGFPDGVDTVPAYLTKGERVVTVEKNKKYWGVLNAINEDDPKKIVSSLAKMGVPVQFAPSYSGLDNPMRGLGKVMAKGNSINFDPLLMSNEISRRSSSRGLSKIHQEIVKLNRNVGRKMLRN